MIARSFWGAKANKGSDEKRDALEEGAEQTVDDLLDARFDDGGKLEPPRKTPTPPTVEDTSTLDELDLAVQKLSEGLEAIERQGRAAPTAAEPEPAEPDEPAEGPDLGGERDFVAHSLDRLEARLEALSKRLQQRSTTPASETPRRPRPVRAADPTPAIRSEEAEEEEDEDIAAQLAESRRLAEAEEAAERARWAEAEAAKARREAEASAEERRRQAILADARRHAEAIEARRQAELSEARRQAAELAEAKEEAEAAEARRRRELAEARREAQAAEIRRETELAEARQHAEAAEARRLAEVAEAKRQAEAAEARRLAEAEATAEELRRQAEEAAEERRRMAEEAAEERKRLVEEAEAIRLADLAEARRQAEAAEARRRAEMEETRRQTDIAAARREAELAAAIERQFSEVEQRLDALQQGLGENQIEPVRAELLDLVKDMSELSRSGRTTSDALSAIGSRIDEMEMKVNAARNMAGNRLGDIQDRLSGLVGRIDQIEVEIPGFDAVRENQSAILERFDRMEGLVHRLASAEELLDRVDGLKRQLQTVASQREVAGIEERLLKLAERLDAMPAEIADEDALGRIEAHLGSVASDLIEARRQRKSVAVALEDQLAEIAAQLREVSETGRTPDLSGIEERLSGVGEQLAEDRRSVGDSLARLERRLGELATAIEAQEDDTTAEVLSGLTEKMDSLSAAIAEQDVSGARRDIGGLDNKLDQLAEQVAAQAEHLSRRQIEPLEARLEEMHAQIEQVARRSLDTSALFKPLVQKLREISERLAGLGAEGAGTPLSVRLEAIEERLAGVANKSADPRGLQTQLDAIVSRLELLKGRSIDPARLNELFDRVEYAIRALPEPREGGEIEAGVISPDRLDAMERRIAEAAASGASSERFALLEKKLDDIGRSVSAGGESLTQEDLADLRSDITSLRRELRSLPAATAGQDEPNLGELMRAIAKRLDRFPQEMPSSIANLEAQIERIAHVLDDPENGPAGIARIHASLRTIEKRLDDTRRSLGYRPPREVAEEVSEEEQELVSGLARSLSDDVSTLKTSAEVSERKTKDAIDAVQDTLEAVVKRMAFLERDTDAGPAPGLAEPAAEEPKPEPPVASAEPAEAPSGGLLSRLTSRQLLRRATGGRAESFSPEAEEAEDASDLPLEPGTDSPLNSSLTGAPSSDTEFMSGGRKGRAARIRGRGHDDEPPIVDDDFLAAARRAARAAAAEADGPDAEAADAPYDEAPQKTKGSRGRGAIVAALIAAALVIAAVLMVRNEVWPVQPIVAFLKDKGLLTERATPELQTAVVPPEESPAVSAPEEESPSPAATAAETPPMPSESSELTAAPEAPTSAPAPEAATATSELRPEDSGSAGTTAAAPSASTTPVASETSSAPAAPTAEVASAEAGSATPPASSPSGETPAAATLPELIGPANLREAALAGDRIAEFEIGARYAEGRGVLEDMRSAVAWYEKSAEAGLAPAQYRLGSIYEKGLGVPRDMAKAQEWYARAADAGNVKAMHNLAVLYAEGAGGEPDLERAAKLFREAAEHGVRDSQFNLAILHARGLGVPQDLVEAYKWFAIAASSGDEELAKRRDIIGQALSDSDRAKAQASAAAFQPLPLVSEANEVLMPDNGWQSDGGSTSVEVKSDNDLVALVQKLLADHGYDPGPADGLLGQKTIDAISQFQGKAGLPRTGQIDTQLVAALQNRST